MTRGRWTVLAVALVLGVAGLVAAVVPRGRDHPDGCSTTTRAVRSPAATTVSGPGERVAVLGDSYTSGYGLAAPQDGYAYLLARGLGWHAAIDGFPGSGFVADAGCPGERYRDRVGRVPPDAALVLVEGGLNDLTSGSAVGPASDEVLSALRARAPRAALVVVGPPLVPGRKAADVRIVGAALAVSAAGHGATYVDTTEWALPYQPDGIHLTVAGHRTFADLVSAALAGADLAAVRP